MSLIVSFLAGVGLAIPCGLNAYLPLLLLSGLARVHHTTTVNSPFDFLATWPAVIILALLVGVEVSLSKLPSITRLHNTFNLIVQPLAGGIAFAAVTNPDKMPQVLGFVIGVALAAAMHLVQNDLHPALVASSKTWQMFEPVISLLQDGIAFMLALLTLFVPVVGGSLAILALVFAYFSTSRLKRKVAVTKLNK